jgi:hypothetical protein
MVSDGTSFSAWREPVRNPRVSVNWYRLGEPTHRPVTTDGFKLLRLAMATTKAQTNELGERRQDANTAVRVGQRYPRYVDLGAPPPNPRSLSPDSTRLFLKKTEPLSRLGLQP